MADESILSGGISNSVAEAPILPVQGGGGMGEISLLDGGIGEIKVVEGGGKAEENIQIIKTYNDILEPEQYKVFKQQYAEKIKQVKKLDYTETISHYSKKGQTNIPTNSTGYIKIKIIPLKTKKLIILPPISQTASNPDEIYINQIMFLIGNNYMSIDSNKNFIIRNNIFVISLSPFHMIDTYINYFSYIIKKSNPYKYYIVRQQFNAFLYPNTETPILISYDEFDFKKAAEIDIPPTDYNTIKTKNIKSMQYKPANDEEYENVPTITNGEEDTDPVGEDYSLKLNNYIAVITLVDEDTRSINIDLQGNKYRIRIALVKSNADTIYSSWSNGKWEMDEKKLLQDLYIIDPILPDFSIPDFLFNLAFYKCFDDVSLLTKAECSSMKDMLAKLYSRALKIDSDEAIV